MAAPNKSSLDYFPHDCNLSTDQKVEYLEAEHGVAGYAIYLKILERIYSHGYYTKFNKRDVVMMSRKTKLPEKEIESIVNTCVRERIFNKDIFEKYNVLTSFGIQNRYIKACERRKAIEIVEEFILVENPPTMVSLIKIASCRDFTEDEDYKDIKIEVTNGKAKSDELIPKKKKEFGAEVYKLYDLFKGTLANGQENLIPDKDNDKEEWLEVLDKCNRIDNYEWWQIADIIYIKRQDEFWYDKFLSPLKLRRKNKEKIRYIDFFWNQVKENLEEPTETSLEYIDGLIGSEFKQQENLK